MFGLSPEYVIIPLLVSLWRITNPLHAKIVFYSKQDGLGWGQSNTAHIQGSGWKLTTNWV